MLEKASSCIYYFSYQTWIKNPFDGNVDLEDRSRRTWCFSNVVSMPISVFLVTRLKGTEYSFQSTEGEEETCRVRQWAVRTANF